MPVIMLINLVYCYHVEYFFCIYLIFMLDIRFTKPDYIIWRQYRLK